MLLLIKSEGQLHLHQYLHFYFMSELLPELQRGALWLKRMGSIPLHFGQPEGWIFLINLPSALALDSAFIFFTSFTLCIPYSAVLWNEMATSKNPSPELMESGRKRKKSLLEMTLLIFSVSHLTGRERARSGGREHHLGLDRCDASCTCQAPLDAAVLKIKHQGFLFAAGKSDPVPFL